MKIVKCKKCNRRMSSEDLYCQNCGTSKKSVFSMVVKSLFLFGTAIILVLFIISGDNSDKNQEGLEYKILASEYLYKKIPYSKYEKLGYPETLDATGVYKWVAYFPKANFTIVSDKKSDIIEELYLGKRELNYGIYYGEK